MSFALDQSLLALVASKVPKETRAPASRPANQGKATPFELPKEEPARAAAARTRAAERRDTPAKPDTGPTEAPRRADPPRRAETSRRADETVRDRSERAERRTADRTDTSPEPSRLSDKRTRSEERDETKSPKPTPARAEASEPERTDAEGDAAAVLLLNGEWPQAVPEADPAEAGLAEAVSLDGEGIPSTEPSDAAASESDMPAEPKVAGLTGPGFGDGALTILAGNPSTPKHASTPEAEASVDGNSASLAAPGPELLETDPEAPMAEDGSGDAGSIPEKREAFAEHLKTEPAGEKGSTAATAKVAELNTDREQFPLSPAGLQAGQAQKPGQVAQAAPAASPQVPVAHQVPVGAVPIEIGLRALAGVNRFEIRLDPAELGRIDVTLDIGEGGEVKAHLVVDRVETLALLQRDAKTLERAFEQAGLKPSEGGVDLSLRDPAGDSRFQQRNQDENGRSGPRANRNEAGDTERSDPPAPPPRPVRWHRASGVDLRI